MPLFRGRRITDRRVALSAVVRAAQSSPTAHPSSPSPCALRQSASSVWAAARCHPVTISS
ncbi:hypothetical protein PF004_g25179 [Phytophthora fragariae]|uniref:Uncharacterized protein n=1 Tax=Phytophthora fragariae TaxID=53985 RepID=A0A6G0MT15_9STRA|nr:hypothetical protein PF004_g25179 [Phytophthora fragariae]KAE9289785.1 hypothetical protein PF008_g25806 [Phytophthora fragariae]